MAREATFEETMRTLEEKVTQALEQICDLRAEQTRLEARIRELERLRAQALERINVVLDRIETEG